MSRDIRAGRAFVELFADKEQLERDLRVAERAVQSFGSALTSLGKRLATVGALAAAALTPAVAIFGGFQEQMSAVQAVTGATGTAFDQLQAKARELGATTAFSAREAAEGMKYLGMAGFDTEQILAGIPHVLKLARAGAVGLGTAADIASDVAGAFGLAAGEIERVADVMAKAAGSANVTITGLGEAMKFAAPAGNAAGQSIEEVNAALATLGSQGLKGGIAGRNLAIIFKQLARTDVQDKLRQVGVAVDDGTGKFRDLHDIVADMKPAFDRMGGIEKTRFLSQAFGEASKAAGMLLEDAEGFAGMREQLDQAAGSASAMAQIVGDNLVGDFNQLNSAAQDLAIALVKALEPSFRGLIHTVTESVRGLGEWIAEHPRIVQAATAMAAGIGLAGTALLGIGTAATAAAFSLGAYRAVVAWSGWGAAVQPTVSLAKALERVNQARTARVAGAAAQVIDLTPSFGKDLDATLGKLDAFDGQSRRVAMSTQSVAAASAQAGARTTLWGAALSKLSGLMSGFSAALGVVGKVGAAVFSIKGAVVAGAVALAAVIGGGLVKAISDAGGTRLQEMGATLRAVFGATLGQVGELVSAIGGGLVAAIESVSQAWMEFGRQINVGGWIDKLTGLMDFGFVRERERGKDLDAKLAESRKKLGITGPDGDKPVAGGPGLEEPENVAQTAAIEIADAIQQFATRVKQEVQSPQEQFAASMAQLREAFGRGLITPEEFQRMGWQLRDDLDRGLIQFADGVRQSLETPQQQFQQYAEQLAQAVASGFLLQEEAFAAADQARQAMEDRLRQEEDARSQALSAPIQRRLDAEIKLLRASGDLHGELKSLRTATREAIDQGLIPFAAQLKAQELETLLSAAQRLDQENDRRDQEARLGTFSALEAAFGLGRKTIDQEQLEESRRIHRAVGAVKAELTKLNKLMED